MQNWVVLTADEFFPESSRHKPGLNKLCATNPIDSTFVTARLRTAKTRACVSRPGILSMVPKLVKSAEGHRRELCGFEAIAKVICCVQFNNGVEVQKKDSQKIAA